MPDLQAQLLALSRAEAQIAKLRAPIIEQQIQNNVNNTQRADHGAPGASTANPITIDDEATAPTPSTTDLNVSLSQMLSDGHQPLDILKALQARITSTLPAASIKHQLNTDLFAVLAQNLQRGQNLGVIQIETQDHLDEVEKIMWRLIEAARKPGVEELRTELIASNVPGALADHLKGIQQGIDICKEPQMGYEHCLGWAQEQDVLAEAGHDQEEIEKLMRGLY